jgi:hypothetical protein
MLTHAQAHARTHLQQLIVWQQLWALIRHAAECADDGGARGHVDAGRQRARSKHNLQQAPATIIAMQGLTASAIQY